MRENEFTIKIETFEGPLDLLLSLIEKRKLFINDVSLARVTDDFIDYVKKMNELPMGITAHFILVASTLLLIKSKSLLPSMTLSEEEQGSIEELEERLKLYKKFKEISVSLQKLFGSKISFAGGQSSISPVFSPEDTIKPRFVLESIQNVLNNLPKENKLPKTVIDKIISLEEMIESLTDRINNELKMSFSEFSKTHTKGEARGARHVVSREDKKNIIVGFLALLELIKRGIVEANQEDMGEDIRIETQKIALPSYK